MNSNLDQQNWWDEQSCREFEQFLDEMEDEAIDEQEMEFLYRRKMEEEGLGEF